MSALLTRFNDEPEPCKLVAGLLGLLDSQPIDIESIEDFGGGSYSYLLVGYVPYGTKGRKPKYVRLEWFEAPADWGSTDKWRLFVTAR